MLMCCLLFYSELDRRAQSAAITPGRKCQAAAQGISLRTTVLDGSFWIRCRETENTGAPARIGQTECSLLVSAQGETLIPLIFIAVTVVTSHPPRPQHALFVPPTATDFKDQVSHFWRPSFLFHRTSERSTDYKLF